jgi:hypothetical protein
MGEITEPAGESLRSAPNRDTKSFRDRGYSYLQYQKQKRKTQDKEAEEERAKLEDVKTSNSEPSAFVVMAQNVCEAGGIVLSGCFAFASAFREAAPSVKVPGPSPHSTRAESRLFRADPVVTVIPVREETDVYAPESPDPDLFKEVHGISCCDYLYYAKDADKRCVVIDGEVQVPTVVDLTNGAPNEFEEVWTKNGVRWARFDCPDKNFATDEDDVCGSKSVLTTGFEAVCTFLDEARKANRLPILIYDDKGMTRATALCVMYVLYAEKIALSTIVDGIDRDIDPLEDNIWKNKRFRSVIHDKALELNLNDDVNGSVWSYREVFCAEVKKITG